MEKQYYITEEERAKCRRVIDAFAELYEIEDEDIYFLEPEAPPSYRFNPEWVEWLMGFPQGWTEISFGE